MPVNCGSVPGKSAEAHERVRARESEQAHETRELRRRVVEHDAAARVDHRALRVEQQLHAFLICPACPLVTGLYERIETLFGYANSVDACVTSFGNVDEHGTGTSRRGEIERLLHRDREVLHVLDEEVVLHARTRDAHRVALLECVLADRVRGHLPRDDDHRDRIHVRRRDAGHGVGDARPGSDEGDADLRRRARIAVGRVHGALLVAYEDVLDLVLLEELVVDVEDRAALDSRRRTRRLLPGGSG
jgi:hypothetical protein